MPGPGTELQGFFTALLASGALEAALDLSVVEFDELAQLAGCMLTRVETSAAGIAVNYTVAWTAFHACDDRRFGGQHARVLRGRVDGGEWVFPLHTPWSIARDTADEF
jgi:hypothetical protein